MYNFLKDKDHERGIWRRCLLTNYTNNKHDWETLLDIDEMSKKDNVKWVYKGSSGLYPSYNRFLVRLSKGGGDAVINKEFDVNKKQFIENGYLEILQKPRVCRTMNLIPAPMQNCQTGTLLLAG